VGKIVLINPNSRKTAYQGLADKLAAFEPPIWAGLMATFVRKHGHEAVIVDSNVWQHTPEETAKTVVDIKPNVAAIVVYGHHPSASTQNMPGAGAAAKAIQEADPKLDIIMVGGHVASLPEQTLREEAVDYVATGEGLHAIVDLLNGRRQGSVRGVVYKDLMDHIRKTVEPPLVMDVSQEMPMVAWGLLPMDKYRAHNWHCFGGKSREPYAAVYTTLGCPYHCHFCCIQAPFKRGEAAGGLPPMANSYRRWEPELVVDQLELLADKYGIKNIKIADEMFVLHPVHVESICDGIIERKLDLNIWAYARVDTVRDKMIDKLKAAGFNWLGFGIESAAESVRDAADKSFTQDEMFKTLEKVRKAGINIGANYIFGLPGDTFDTMQQTLDLAIEINAEYANFYSSMAYPGSKLYDDAIKNGWQLPKSWGGYAQHAFDATPLPTGSLSAQEIVRFRDNAFNAYFNNKRYLQMMEQKFGSVVVQEIKSMCIHKLQRQ
jgi:anaerobic magnesium-protoporphyrin IX monomethyl ester cyclase